MEGNINPDLLLHPKNKISSFTINLLISSIDNLSISSIKISIFEENHYIIVRILKAKISIVFIVEEGQTKCV